VIDEEIILKEAASMRRILQDIEHDIQKLRQEKEELAKQEAMDYGPDAAFFVLQDKCIEKKIEVRKGEDTSSSSYRELMTCVLDRHLDIDA
jgi:hypothetical protein